MSYIINKVEITRMYLDSDDDYEPYGFDEIDNAPDKIFQSKLDSKDKFYTSVDSKD